MRPLQFPLSAGAVLGIALLFGSAPLALADTATVPSTIAGTTTAAGNSLSDDQGVLVSTTTTAEYFGTNQPAARGAEADLLWWAVAIAGLAIITLAWFGYRELA